MTMDTINDDLNALADDLLRAVAEEEAEALLDEIILNYINLNLPQPDGDLPFPWEL